jgi:two-component system, NarL family, invasion response regulator UvrY
MQSVMKRILIVEDHAIVRDGMIHVLEDNLDKVYCGEAKTAAEALQKLTSAKWDLVLLDIELPDKSGFSVLEALGERVQSIPVLVVSTHSEQDRGVQAIQLGARGYVTKSSTSEDIVAAVKQVLDGKLSISHTLAVHLAERLRRKTLLPHESLSRRELQVFMLLANGKTQKKAAAEMGVSPKTVSAYHTSVNNKMGMSVDTEWALYAVKHKLNDSEYASEYASLAR